MRKHRERNINETIRHQLTQAMDCERSLSDKGVKVTKVIVGLPHNKSKLIVDPQTVRGKLHGAMTHRGRNDKGSWVIFVAGLRGCLVEWKKEVMA